MLLKKFKRLPQMLVMMFNDYSKIIITNYNVL